MTHFKWADMRIGPMQAITPRPGEEAAGEITPQQHIKSSLGLTDKDDRPVLIHFHWPHDHATHGKFQLSICSRTLDDEQLARWGTLFNCVQVDVAESEENFLDLIGVGKKPSFVVLDKDLKVVAKLDASKSPTKMRKALEKAFNKFPAYKKKIKKQLAQQKKWLAQAKKLEKQDKLDDAIELLDKIRFGKLRIGDEFDKAYALGVRLQQKVEDELGG